MSNMDDRAMQVTGEEHAHPSIRLLARACIELARQQLSAEHTATQTGQAPGADPASDRPGETDEQPTTGQEDGNV